MFDYLEYTSADQQAIVQKVPFSFEGDGKQYDFKEFIKEVKANPLKFLNAVINDQLSIQLPLGFIRVPKMFGTPSHLKVKYLKTGGEENPFIYYSVDEPGTVELYENLLALDDYMPIHDGIEHHDYIRAFTKIEIENERTGTDSCF